MLILTIALVAAAAAAAAAACIVRTLGVAITGARSRPKSVRFQVLDGRTVRLQRSELTSAVGSFYLYAYRPSELHVEIGPILRTERKWVTRRAQSPVPSALAMLGKGRIAGYGPLSAQPFKDAVRDLNIPAPDGTMLPAWLIDGDPAHWAIHVQGIRTSRAVTLRSMQETIATGATTLSITFRGCGELASRSDRCALGAREWVDLRAAAMHAKRQGAERITIVGWSMGAGLALELAHRHPSLVDDLILIAPALNWVPIIRAGAARAGLPRAIGTIMCSVLSTRIGARLVGLDMPVSPKLLDWGTRTQSRPTSIIHSAGDEEIPFAQSASYAALNKSVTLHQFANAPHAWEANADPVLFSSVMRAALDSP